MAKSKKDKQYERFDISHFEGVNALVSHNIAKKEELSEAINARSLKIGTIEKRQGYRRLGDVLGSTAEYGLFYFEEGTANKRFFRISKVGGVVSFYYLNITSNWTVLTGNGTGLGSVDCSFTTAEDCMFVVNGTDDNMYVDSTSIQVYTSADLGTSTTQFDITDEGGGTFRYTYDTTGTDPKIKENMKAGDVVHCMGQNFAAANKGAFIVTAVDTNHFEITNAGAAENNKTLGTGALRVNNHLTGSPKANKINFYKNRLYLGDYTDTTRYKTGIMMSSVPLGIVALVDDDHDQPFTELKVTDLKYIHTDDVLDVYRGNSKIGTLIVTAKNADTNTLTVDTFTTDLKSSDELWVGGTYTGQRIFRWADNPESGVDVKQYDTFKLTGGDNDALTIMENVGDVMTIGNKKNLSFWNDFNLENFDLGIGCVSNRGYIKHLGILFFMDYTGIYMTTGAERPKLISSKVEPYFTGASKAGIEAGAMGKRGYSIYAAIHGSVLLYNPDGSTIRPYQWHTYR